MNNNKLFNHYHNDYARIYRFFTIMTVFFVAMALQGCKKFIEVDMPVAELNAKSVYEEKNTAYAAMANVFAEIRDNGMLTGKTNGMTREMGLYTDELTWYGNTAQASANFYNNTIIPTHGTIATWWNNCYSQIYAANAVIEGVSASKNLLQVDKDRLTGEAKFVRAFLHMYLSQLWGEVPYVSGTDYKFNSNVLRLPIMEVYAKIIEDLEAASILLPKEYLNSTRVHPNFYAAKALLARVYLYKGDWAKAASNASEVLNNTATYVWVTELNNVFLKESTTTIWQYAPRSATRNTDDGTTFIFNSGPPLVVALTSSLVNAFENGDQRKVKWLRSRSSGVNTWYHSFKYKKTGSSTPQTEFTIVLRLAEMYLIRAEARAQQEELDGAADDLNKIRNTAGLGNTSAITKIEILEAILRERRVELFTEFGHRFMDLKRFNAIDAALLGSKASWQSTDNLLPIPQGEINLNPNIAPQNLGY